MKLPSESPRYLFIAFNHEREGAVETFISMRGRSARRQSLVYFFLLQ
jgi:hypothetical protein